MKRKIVSVLLCVLLLASLLPVSAFADTTAGGKCGDNLTWTLDGDGTLTIRGTGKMKDYYPSNNDTTAPWGENCSLIKSVVISDGVTSIGYRAFSGCSSLTDFTIPASVGKIGFFVFEDCSKLTEIRYERNDLDFSRNKFRLRGDTLEIYPAYSMGRAFRVEFFGDEIDRISEINAVSGIAERFVEHVAIYPASHYVTTKDKMDRAIGEIRKEMEEQVKVFTDNDQLVEAQRIRQRTEYDMEMMAELGYCSGIENYSRIISERPAGSAPMTLLDFFPDDFLLFVDESHVTLPQVRAMYNGDRARKDSLVKYGFRLPCAYDNRPLKFEEFEERIGQAVFVSATPGPYERERADQVVEQVIRPTGLLDPRVEVRPVTGQIDDLMDEINQRAAKNERVLVTTLTKKMAEDLTEFFKNAGIRVRYMHSDVQTIERMEIIRDLRLGEFDVLVGINLLREGLDLPEVSLVAILDADKIGFLRSATSLIQTIGRAARNSDGRVIMYADQMSDAMREAIVETEHRREVQNAYNEEHGITPQTIRKAVEDYIEHEKEDRSESQKADLKIERSGYNLLTQSGRNKYIKALEKEMRTLAEALEFERAAVIRDEIELVKSGKYLEE